MQLFRSTQTSLWLLALYSLLGWQASQAAHHFGMSHGTGKALGVTISEVPFEALAANELEYGVRVVGVSPGSPAHAAGLKKDDIITSLNDKPAYSTRHLQWLVREAPEDEAVPVRIRRDQAMETTSVTFPSAKPPKPRGMAGRWPSSYLGVQFQPMTSELRTAFGAPSDRGVLVVAVADEGPAKAAGLAVGDVILGLGAKPIASMEDMYGALSYFNAGDDVDVKIVRDKTPQTLTATLGKSPMSMSYLPGRGHHHHRHPYVRP